MIANQLSEICFRRKQFSERLNRYIIEYESLIRKCDEELRQIQKEMRQNDQCLFINGMGFDIVTKNGYSSSCQHNYVPGDLYCMLGGWYGRLEGNKLYLIASKKSVPVQSIEVARVDEIGTKTEIITVSKED